MNKQTPTVNKQPPAVNRDDWLTGWVECRHCGHRWLAQAHPRADRSSLECPGCHRRPFSSKPAFVVVDLAAAREKRNAK